MSNKCNTEIHVISFQIDSNIECGSVAVWYTKEYIQGHS